MGSSAEAPARTSWINGVLKLIMHQAIAASFAFLIAGMAAYIFAGWVRLFGWRITVHALGALLVQNPYHPIQIGIALFLGWSLGGWLQHRTMLWVWIIPAIILGYKFATFPWNGPVEFDAHWSLGWSTRLTHFFGWGCRWQNHCLEQMEFTLPFYVAVAYSIGAYAGRLMMKRLRGYAERMNQIRLPRVLLVGGAVACYDLTLEWRQIAMVIHQWNSAGIGLLFCTLLVEVALATYVLMVAVSLLGGKIPPCRWFLNPNLPAQDIEAAPLPIQT